MENPERIVEFFVDDKLVDSAFLAGDTTVEQALQHVQSNLCPPNHVVVALQCDGRQVPADAMAETLQKPAVSFEQLQVVTGTKGDLVIDAMDQASACLTQTEETCTRIAQLLTEGKTVDAAETLGECVLIWQPIHESVAKSIEMLQLDLEQTTVNDHRLIELIDKVKDVLLQIRDALKEQDFVLLADLLEYEFGEVAQSWRTIIALLRQEAEDLKSSCD